MITIEEIFIPPANVVQVLDQRAIEVPNNWQTNFIHIVECPYMMGDVQEDAMVSNKDLIYLARYVFQGGPSPVPRIEVADADCSAAVTSADIIYLVNYTMKGGPAPCPCYVPLN